MAPSKSRSSVFTRKPPFYEYSSPPHADIREDTTANPTIYHCVVQPEDSPEVLFFGQSYTMEEAEEMALQYIRERKGETA